MTTCGSIGKWRQILMGTLWLGVFSGCAASSDPSTAPSTPPAPELVRVEVASPYAGLESVKAFERLQGTMEAMKRMVLTDARSDREAYEGMRAILRVLAMSSEVTGDANPRMPHFHRMDSAVRKVGGDNPDAEYHNVALDNGRDYVVRGNVGSVRHLSFTVNGARGRDGRAPTIGYFNERTLAPDAAGDFEIHLARQDPGHPNWVDTAPGVSGILVRQYIGDRDRERLAEFDIEVVGRDADFVPAYSTDAEIARAIAGTTYGFQYMMTMHRTILPELWESPNRFLNVNSDTFGADISGSDNLYMFGTYQIEEDEALVIETDPLDVRYWNLAIESRWHDTVDYADRRTHRTLDDVVLDPDGKLRFVLAHGRSPHPNWLDTGGHAEGFMTFRWVGERDAVVAEPIVLRVNRSALAEVLAKRQGGGS